MIQNGLGEWAVQIILAKLNHHRSAKNLRDIAIIQLMTIDCLRVGEVLQLNLSSLDLDHEQVYLKANGQRGPSKAKISSQSVKAINAWLNVRGRGNPGPLFISFNRRSKGSIVRLTRIGLYFSMRKLLSSVGLNMVGGFESFRIEKAKAVGESNQKAVKRYLSFIKTFQK